ncbi:response regulator [Leptospira gomenensis]|uniref:Response regulator n=1 Tax=Leptospira gomenensis TaxID=2484974 RepID=A0A5F1YT12_9LEPT|nr:response regulator [Leptospira gomenensis]TGK38613.1 response regulator [Leptospira gomenensis]TGK42850.1 response regulator [Leptospira gomenensis]TGK49605.1 response regulator [Leptospira gomenensis]TGK60725.1 response regulator [Leptospira gomenensis]
MNAPSLKILYVEDEELIRIMMVRFLERFQFSVCSAENGEVAWNLFLEYNPDVVITDIKMPLLDGIELTRRIREQNSNIPIAAMTAFSEPEIIEEAKRVGVSEILFKPVNVERIKALLLTYEK